MKRNVKSEKCMYFFFVILYHLPSSFLQGVYMCLSGLPVLNGIAPTVEAITESLINMTPLKPSPEEVRQNSVLVRGLFSH